MMGRRVNSIRLPGESLQAAERGNFTVRGFYCLLFLFVVFAFALPSIAETNAPVASSKPFNPAEHAKKEYMSAQARFEIHPENHEAAWQFARAAFDWADFAGDNKQREKIALQGIAAARRAIVLKSGSVAAHYYLGMNLGQLARTKSIGALKLVGEMESEFKRARELDKLFDHAGSDRNLGLLYLEAPSTFSVGDRKKAREHLTNATRLSPNYPGNRLNLIDAHLKWNDAKAAQAELADLDKIWPVARKELVGDQWESSWAEWETRRTKARERIRSLLPRR